MLSRILWVGVAGIALIAGMAVQDGESFFGWSDDREVSARTERAVEEKVERAIEGSFDKMKVEGPDGREIEVPPETKRALANAVGELVEAEADLAFARIGDDDEEAVKDATARRIAARREVDRLKAEIKGYQRAANSEKGELRDQIQREIREDVRESVRGAVRS